MPVVEKPILMVGSAPGENAEEVLSTFSSGLGELALAYSDGETGLRRGWVIFLAITQYMRHPDLEQSFSPPGGKPTGYGDLPRFRVKDGVSEVAFETLGYAEEARKSYEVFKRLRAEGKAPASVRFQVCLPLPEDAVHIFAETAEDHITIAKGYEAALAKEIQQICEIIPPADLLIQFDINWEVLAIAADDTTNERPLSFSLPGDPTDRYVDYIKKFGALIPEEAKFGLHLCYGDLAHRHYFEPKDLQVTVDMANAAHKARPRRIDYVHMPFPKERMDEAYFAPLKDLDMGDATLYAGLLHLTDGVEGSLKRAEILQRHYNGPFGVATECGIGHRPPDHTLDRLLTLHREVAQAL